jgi:hypothetical protein
MSAKIYSCQDTTFHHGFPTYSFSSTFGIGPPQGREERRTRQDRNGYLEKDVSTGTRQSSGENVEENGSNQTSKED